MGVGDYQKLRANISFDATWMDAINNMEKAIPFAAGVRVFSVDTSDTASG